MRRLLPAAIFLALLVGVFAGGASARFADPAAEARTARDPFRVPAALPAADPTQSGAYGYRRSEAIAAELEAAASTGGRETPAGNSATVTVTATVLPVLIIVVDRQGTVTELFTNTPDRRATDVLFLVRRQDESGAPVELGARTWAQARAALRQARAGTGSVWAA